VKCLDVAADLVIAADGATVVVAMGVVVSASLSKTLEPVIAPTAITLTKLVLKELPMESVTPTRKLVLAKR
jgi:hypothetical protein